MSAHIHLPNDPSGPGSPPFCADVSPRYASSRSTCASIAICANRCRINGSVVPFNSSASSLSATCTRACSANASPARSCINVVMATRQPLSTPPTTFSTGIRASSMNSSLNSASPVIWTSGRMSTPSCSMSIRK